MKLFTVRVVNTSASESEDPGTSDTVAQDREESVSVDTIIDQIKRNDRIPS
jgi:hypothetical protein